jgi:hypothetical protein
MSMLPALISLFMLLTRVFLQSLMARSREKSQFLCCQKDAWDHLTKEAWLHRELTEQLITACQKVAELAPTGEEVTSLRISEADAR